MNRKQQGSTVERLYRSSHLNGVNAAYIEAWYEEWLQQPDNVPAACLRRWESTGNME